MNAQQRPLQRIAGEIPRHRHAYLNGILAMGHRVQSFSDQGQFPVRDHGHVIQPHISPAIQPDVGKTGEIHRFGTAQKVPAATTAKRQEPFPQINQIRPHRKSAVLTG